MVVPADRRSVRRLTSGGLEGVAKGGEAPVRLWGRGTGVGRAARRPPVESESDEADACRRREHPSVICDWTLHANPAGRKIRHLAEDGQLDRARRAVAQYVTASAGPADVS